jgi:hypothetical protein
LWDTSLAKGPDTAGLPAIRELTIGELSGVIERVFDKLEHDGQARQLYRVRLFGEEYIVSAEGPDEACFLATGAWATVHPVGPGYYHSRMVNNERVTLYAHDLVRSYRGIIESPNNKEFRKTVFDVKPDESSC